jgi:PIN domain nuclease of toxin-antitoxin system
MVWRVKVLTDTHALVWAIDAPELLSVTARKAIERGEVIASVVNLWELMLKRGKKNALLSDPLPWWNRNIVGSGILVLGIHNVHVAALHDLPDLHGDPFDRILVAQCKVEGATLISRDRNSKGYPVPVAW